MNKNFVKAGIGIVVGTAILATSAFMSLASGPTGYDSLKEILKNSKNLENATIDLVASVDDNGKNVLSATAKIKADHKNDQSSGSANLKVSNIEKSFKFYKDGENSYLKLDDQNTFLKFDEKGRYGERNKNFKERGKNENDSKFTDLHEKILDALVGDLKKQVEETDSSNGDKKISVKLSESQIPEVVNALLAAKGEKHINKEVSKDSQFKEIFGISKDDLKINELVSDLKVKEINLELVSDKNKNVKELNLLLTVSGKDKSSISHTQTIKVKADISNVGSTTVDKVNLTGAQVKTISCKELK
jgi:hypothetical protein